MYFSLNRTVNTIAFIFLFSFLNVASAATIMQSKGNKVLIGLEGEKVSVGQTVSFKNDEDKVVATAVIQQAKGARAIALIKSGKLDGTESVVFSSNKGDEEENIEDNISPDSFSKKAKSVYRLNSTKISALLTISMNNMNTKQSDGVNPTPNTEDVPLKGNSFGLTGAIDFPFTNWLILRGTLGYEPFNVAGTSSLLVCDNLSSRDCTAMINYLSAGGYARFNITKSRTQIWAAVGGTGKFPISKSTTALRSDDIKMTMTFGAGGGLDFFINNKMFLPVSFEYQMFQSSETVSANMILLRAGFGWAF